jgi:hypothetical protein
MPTTAAREQGVFFDCQAVHRQTEGTWKGWKGEGIPPRKVELTLQSLTKMGWDVEAAEVAFNVLDYCRSRDCKATIEADDDSAELDVYDDAALTQRDVRMGDDGCGFRDADKFELTVRRELRDRGDECVGEGVALRRRRGGNGARREGEARKAQAGDGGFWWMLI